jgi:hypothetical protein
MELHLSVHHQDGATVVNVDGRLAMGAVRELERIVVGAASPVVLDLTNLLSADDVGVATLRALARRGVRLTGMSPYVTLLLRDPAGSTSREVPGRRGDAAPPDPPDRHRGEAT